MEDEYAPSPVAASVLALLAAVISWRATFVESFFGKQWHVMVFLLRNVVLLAILFTSRDHPAAKSGDEVKKAEKKRRVGRRARPRMVEARPDPDDGSGGEREGFGYEMSDEELNERVERFIAAFRQHLVLDGRAR